MAWDIDSYAWVQISGICQVDINMGNVGIAMNWHHLERAFTLVCVPFIHTRMTLVLAYMQFTLKVNYTKYDI